MKRKVPRKCPECGRICSLESNLNYSCYVHGEFKKDRWGSLEPLDKKEQEEKN